MHLGVELVGAALGGDAGRSMYVYIYIYTCICLYIFTHTHTHICTYTNTYIYVYIHIYIYICMYVYIHMHQGVELVGAAVGGDAGRGQRREVGHISSPLWTP